MSEFKLNMEEYQAKARQAIAEGCVLLKNENQTLPLEKGDRVAVFGRMAANYYKSGLGSGGLVNTKYVVSVLDALKESDDVKLDKKLLKLYEEYNETHPLDEGHGWGTVPWNQEEMIIDDAAVEDAAEYDDVAIVIVGRTAGEDQDNSNKPGSYLLTDAERDLIAKVTKHFKRTAVLLNVGNIIDMKWVEELQVSAVVYIWQGGQEGGNGVVDVLLGQVSPCGKLTDTIARNLSDYPADRNFGNAERNFYAEDIYVGYRYFETFAPEKVLYPFGFGLSYSKFEMTGQVAASSNGPFVNVSATVTNVGDKFEGKEVAQLYVKAPQGKLGKPSRVLVAFDKTRNLLPGESTHLLMTVPKKVFASFDDSGVSGYKNAYVLEEGIYEFYLGSDVRSAKLIGSYEQEFTVISQLEEAFAPTKSFDRIRPGMLCKDGTFEETFEAVPLRTVDPADRKNANLPRTLAITGDMGIKLEDVYHFDKTLDEFIAQLSADELIMLTRGEGMSCPKVTPGTGSGFGGLVPELEKYGIPATCTTDGPSGLRMDCGTRAFSLPNGTSLGCTFNVELVEELYGYTGLELRKNRIDALLGPGMNIHRFPLNGRNFEYISEDPLVTGKMGAAQVRGLSIVGSTATIKHFCANNQEFKRHEAEGVISQRALREIYLKGFEIAVREGKARSVMTTYGPINNMWTSSSYDLCTTILRKEWGFNGIVMTDWWAKGSTDGGEGDRALRSPMVSAGNDLYMCTIGQANMEQDDIQTALSEGKITVGELQELARHILGFILKSPAMLYQMNAISQEELDDRAEIEEGDVDIESIENYYADDEGLLTIEKPDWNLKRNDSIVLATNTPKFGEYRLKLTIHSDLEDLAQLPVSIFFDNKLVGTLAFQGSNGAEVTKELDGIIVLGATHFVKLYMGADGVVIDKVEMIFEKELNIPFF